MDAGAAAGVEHLGDLEHHLLLVVRGAGAVPGQDGGAVGEAQGLGAEEGAQPAGGLAGGVLGESGAQRGRGEGRGVQGEEGGALDGGAEVEVLLGAPGGEPAERGAHGEEQRSGRGESGDLDGGHCAALRVRCSGGVNGGLLCERCSGP
ncbi:hypothetical protein GCM10018987_51080 [Streptomyces cremeus]